MKKDWLREIEQHRRHILDRWIGAGLELFTGTMTAASPAGESLADGMELVLGDFDGSRERCSEGIARIARFLAVHASAPSASLSLFFTLEKILVGYAPDESSREECRGRIRQMVLEAFDRYMESREIIYRMKVEESQRKMHMLLRRAVS
jgi:hypothetical protein